MKWLWIVIAVPMIISGCRKPGDDQTTESIGEEEMQKARTEPSPGLVAQLDSGNQAYKAKDWERALQHYRAVTRIDQDMPAGWFGIYMVEMARGNAPAADSALQRAQKRAPGASLIHP